MLLLLAVLFNFIESGPRKIPVQLEQAVTPEQREHGLMDRTFLGENEGMLFSYDQPTPITIWMYHTQIDLAVAFLDQQGVIREIHELKAYPQIRDPSFFSKNSVTSSFKATYALEMGAHWFEKNGVRIGDKLKVVE